jgi:hypothetical protein
VNWFPAELAMSRVLKMTINAANDGFVLLAGDIFLFNEL